jgi:hypothetical protein
MGMAACCTGVVFTKPIASTASRIHSDSAGVRALNARSTFVWGAILHDLQVQPVWCRSMKRNARRCARTFAAGKKVGARSDWPVQPRLFRVGAAQLAARVTSSYALNVRCARDDSLIDSQYRRPVPVLPRHALCPVSRSSHASRSHCQAGFSRQTRFAHYSHQMTTCPISCLSHNNQPARGPLAASHTTPTAVARSHCGISCPLRRCVPSGRIRGCHRVSRTVGR